MPKIKLPRLPSAAVLALTYVVTGLTLTDNSFSSPYKEIAAAVIAIAGTWFGIFPVNIAIQTHAMMHYLKGRDDAVTDMAKYESDGNN